MPKELRVVLGRVASSWPPRSVAAHDDGVEHGDVVRPLVADLGRSKPHRVKDLGHVALLRDGNVDGIARDWLHVIVEDAADAGQDRRGRRQRVAVEIVFERDARADGFGRGARRVETRSRRDGAREAEGDDDRGHDPHLDLHRRLRTPGRGWRSTRRVAVARGGFFGFASQGTRDINVTSLISSGPFGAGVSRSSRPITKLKECRSKECRLAYGPNLRVGGSAAFVVLRTDRGTRIMGDPRLLCRGRGLRVVGTKAPHHARSGSGTGALRIVRDGLEAYVPTPTRPTTRGHWDHGCGRASCGPQGAVVYPH
mmetsp:Transcript_14383/g.57244  ORF Transcript_14383/g.57244 Transcript_14383/m.57244 type:complete len:311 (-) Transcript_14383:10-942(-)